MEDYSLDTIMDQLNVSTIKFLGSLIHSTETVKNCRIVNHGISIKLGEFLLVDPKELTQQAKNIRPLTYRFLICRWRYQKKPVKQSMKEILQAMKSFRLLCI